MTLYASTARRPSLVVARNKSEKVQDTLQRPHVISYLRAWVATRAPATDRLRWPWSSAEWEEREERRRQTWKLLSEPEEVVVRQLSREERVKFSHGT